MFKEKKIHEKTHCYGPSNGSFSCAVPRCGPIFWWRKKSEDSNVNCGNIHQGGPKKKRGEREIMVVGRD